KAKARPELAGGDDVNFLADVVACNSGRRSCQWCAAAAVQRVVRVIEPVSAISGSSGPAFRDYEVEPAANVSHVLPADEVGEAVLVVAGGVELVERALLVVGRTLVPRCPVVLG